MQNTLAQMKSDRAGNIIAATERARASGVEAIAFCRLADAVIYAASDGVRRRDEEEEADWDRHNDGERFDGLLGEEADVPQDEVGLKQGSHSCK